MFFLAMEQDMMQNNGTPSPTSGLIFNTAQYPSKGRFFYFLNPQFLYGFIPSIILLNFHTWVAPYA
jgi:hypothetical protein